MTGLGVTTRLLSVYRNRSASNREVLLLLAVCFRAAISPVIEGGDSARWPFTRSNETFDMARKASSGGVNKSEAIRNLLKENPKLSAKEAIDALAAKGIKVKQNLFYLVK
jgi:hypothetical protein